ncbi:O-antigen ligase [Halovivax sp.]|uniref:O-antigen ligase family protein n=1 Tax=Halovivax sp. TaxID=1935978 RepID=UPI0025BE4848|nr:O-antigen ligase family protein [Halovivax sp.]
MSAQTTEDRVALRSAWSRLPRVPLFELLVAFSLFPAVYVGADRLQPVEAVAPASAYHLAVGGATVVAIAVFLYDRRVYPLSAFVLVAYLLFVGWAIYSLRWTVGNDGYTDYKLHRMIVFNTLLLAFGLVLAQSRRRVVAFGLVMGVVGLWLSAEAVYASYVLGEFAFVTVGSENYLTHGRAIGFAAPLLAYVLFAHPQYSLRVLAGALLAALVVGSMVAGGRGPFVAIVVALATFAILEGLAAGVQRRISARGLLATAAATVGVGAAVALAVRSLDGTPWAIERLLVARESDEAETRLFMLREAYGFWREEPLRGHGIGSYDVMTATVHDYPHNVVVEVLAELGLVGLALAALVVLPPLLACFYARFSGGDALYSALVALFVFMFVNASLSFDLHANRQLFFAAGLMALAWTEAEAGWLSRSFPREDS